jgi:hypothetical protein
MLSPKKYNHPDQTVIGLSFLILKELSKKKLMKYDDILEYSKKKIDGAEVLFLASLSLLFILGVIEYHSKTDSIEYTRLIK